MAAPLSPTRALVLASKDPDQSHMTSTLSASPNMVAGGYSTSLDTPLQAAPTLPFGVQAIPTQPQQPVIYINDERSAAYIAWETAMKMAKETQPCPSSPARTPCATPQIVEPLPYLVTSAQPPSDIDADMQALLAEALDDFDDTPDSQYNSAQRVHSSPTL